MVTSCAFVHTEDGTRFVNIRSNEWSWAGFWNGPDIQMPSMPNELKIDIYAAQAAFVAGELDRAESLCQALLSENSNHAGALHLRGALSLRCDRLLEALQWFDRALEAGSTDAALLSNCGEVYRRLGRYVDAKSYLEGALKADNSNPAPHFNLAKLYRANGEPRLAEHFLRNVLLLDSSMARAHHELAELYRSEGHTAEAETEYRAALEGLTLGNWVLDEEKACIFSRWSTSLGSLLRERGDTRSAIMVLHEAIARDSRNGLAHFEIAKCMFELCSESKAHTHYLSASSLDGSLGGEHSGRLVLARITRLKDWCAQEGVRYTMLARGQWLSLPAMRVLPLEAQFRFRLGAPVTSEAFVATIPNAEVLPRQFAVLSEDGSLFVDGLVNWPQFYPQNGECVRHATDDLRVMLDLPKSCVEVDGACAVIGGAGDHFAWMFEALSRLWALEQHPASKHLLLVVPDDLSEERLEMLDAAGVDRSRVLRLPARHTLRAKELVLPSLLTVGDWVSPLALQFLRRIFAIRQGRRARRLFLSRRAALQTRVANESELLPILEWHGFEVIDCIATSPMELLSALVDAEAVVASDDDSLANLVVVPQHARIGVIISEGIVRTRGFFISAQLGQELTYLVAQPDFESSATHAHCDITLASGVLEQFLEGLARG